MRAARVVAALGCAVALAATAACGAEVKGSEIESKIAEQTAQLGNRATDISCPDLPAREGQSVTCTFTLSKQDYRARVEVRSIDGKRVSYAVTGSSRAK